MPVGSCSIKSRRMGRCDAIMTTITNVVVVVVIAIT